MPIENAENPRLLHELRSAATRLPTTARIFERMNEALRNPDVSVEEIVAVINQDASIALRVMRLANSAQFVRGEQFLSLESAIDWIGVTDIYHIVASTVSARLFCDNLALYGIGSTAIWKNAVATGTAMNLAASSIHVDPRMAYSIGLFRPVGRLILDKLAKLRGLPPAPRSATARCADGLNWEKNTFTLTNADAVGLVFAMWGLHPALGECVRHHFHPEAAIGGNLSVETALLHVCCWIAQESGHGLPIEYGAWNCTPEILQQAGLKEEKLPDLVKRTAEITQRLTMNVSNN